MQTVDNVDNWLRCVSFAPSGNGCGFRNFAAFLCGKLVRSCVSALQSALARKRGGAIVNRHVLMSLASRKIDNQLAELIRVIRTLGTTWGHGHRMASLCNRGKGRS